MGTHFLKAYFSDLLLNLNILKFMQLLSNHINFYIKADSWQLELVFHRSPVKQKHYIVNNF